MKFQIKCVAGKPKKEGDVFIRYEGISEPFTHGDEMGCVKIGVDKDGTPKLKFRTGLDEDQVDFYGWFNTQEKAEFKEFLKNHREKIVRSFGGEDVVDSTNRYFWLDDVDRNRLKIDNETLNIVYDTNNLEHCLLYINIMGGAFLELVAPTKEMAESPRTGLRYYVEIESNFTDEDVDDYLTKAEAYSYLTELKDAEGDSLLFLAWCLQSMAKSFGAYSRSSTKLELIKYHAEFIEGKLNKTGKKNTIKEFIEYSKKWKTGGLSREGLMVEAYLKAAEYYSYLNTNKDNKYELTSGLILGLNMEEAVKKIRKPVNTEELQKLRDFVENKWKE